MKRLAAVALGLFVGAASANAQTITDGFTFAVASGGNACGTGTHYHSNTGGSYGNPAGKAEVGRYSSECVHGLSEYNLSGLTSSPTAFVTFNVFKAGGLFTGVNDTPFNGTIDVFAYAGNNSEDISDYQAPSIGTVGSFNTLGLLVGSTISLDITSIFNNAIAGGQSSLGIRLQRRGETDALSQAWTFDTFHLTSNDQTTTVTPEPSTYLLLASGLAVMGVVAQRRRRNS